MPTPTPGLGLQKPIGSDNWRDALKVSVAGAFDLLDAAVVSAVNVTGSGYAAAGDGTTDDRAALLAAEAALPAAGGALYLPPGTYRLASSTAFKRTTTLLFLGGAT